MIEMPCPNCGHAVTINDYVCPSCSSKIIVCIENQSINNPVKQELDISDLRIGESVMITNQEHPYFEDIALICDKKHLFVRLELHGYKIWMPNDWVKKHV